MSEKMKRARYTASFPALGIEELDVTDHVESLLELEKFLPIYKKEMEGKVNDLHASFKAAGETIMDLQPKVDRLSRVEAQLTAAEMFQARFRRFGMQMMDRRNDSSNPEKVARALDLVLNSTDSPESIEFFSPREEKPTAEPTAPAKAARKGRPRQGKRKCRRCGSADHDVRNCTEPVPEPPVEKPAAKKTTKKKKGAGNKMKRAAKK